MAATIKNYETPDSITLSLAVIMDRIRSLPEEDRQDLYELSKEFILAVDEEDRASAAAAMHEILEQQSSQVSKLELPETASEELQSWVDHVGGRIAYYRKESGLTQEQLSEKAGLPQSHISRLESGVHSPSFLTIEKIAKALEIKPSDLDPSA